jgi:hypothetical protein
MCHISGAIHPCILGFMALSALQVCVASGEHSVGKKLQDASARYPITSDAERHISEPVPYWFEVYNLLDPAQLFLFVGAQTLSANLNDALPVDWLPRLNPLDPNVVMKPCRRADVSTCLRYGEPLLRHPPCPPD